MRTSAPIAPVLAALMVAGCGGAGTGEQPAPSGWAIDACETFPVAAAARASGLAIETAMLGAQTSVNGTDVSSCSYATAGNRETFGILLREDRSGRATIDEQLASVSSAPAETGPSEPVAMPRGKAVWQPQLRSLSYIPADGRMIVVTPPFIGLSAAGTDPEKLKATAIRIALAVAG